MRRRFLLSASAILILVSVGFSQHTKSIKKVGKIISEKETSRILNHLASDDMGGRGTFTPSIDKAASYISAEFKKVGLKPVKDGSYLQPFTLRELALARAFGMKGPDQDAPMANVIGILPGKSKPDEIVIFSGHYDHLGIGQPLEGDSIFNGANDDASGITAVIQLAKYFSKTNMNERTLVFAAFTAEEIGGFGSKYFSKQFDSSKVVAMFNIEMIGTESKWGAKSAFITGYEKTDMGAILEKNLVDTDFKFYPDPYPQQQLFYRSDNATLARQGVPAHTISTSKMDVEVHYHTVKDEVSTLDLKNMTQIIRAIAISSKSIVEGTDTPSRVNTGSLR